MSDPNHKAVDPSNPKKLPAVEGAEIAEVPASDLEDAAGGWTLTIHLTTDKAETIEKTCTGIV
jgi:hypothetical protein